MYSFQYEAIANIQHNFTVMGQTLSPVAKRVDVWDPTFVSVLFNLPFLYFCVHLWCDLQSIMVLPYLTKLYNQINDKVIHIEVVIDE